MFRNEDLSPIFVIGTSGFAGSSFVKYLLDRGVAVYGFSRSNEPESCFLPYKWSQNQELFTFEQMDLNNDLDRFLNRISEISPSYIVNFASQSMVGQSWDNPEDWIRTNVLSMTLLLKGLAKFDFLGKYIHFTTPEVYGSTEGWVKESFRFSPSTPYAVSRAAGDWMVKLWQETFEVPAIFTRAANIYGEGQQLYRIIPKTILYGLTGRKISLHGGGQSSRAFIHMDDTSAALVKIIESGAIGDTYHISPRESLSILKLVQRIGEKLSISDQDLFTVSEDRIGKDKAYLLDSQHLIETIGWECNVSMDEGLDRCIEWVQKDLSSLESASDQYVHKP